MIRLIAHRGLMYGPNKDIENSITQIEFALQHNFDVEIDIWYHNWQNTETQWWLGHDQPTYNVDVDWLKNLPLNRVWFHAKDIGTLAQLSKESWPVHYFAHENDPVVLTSSKYLWTFPGRQLTDQSIMVLPENDGMAHIEMYSRTIQGVCSDYVVEILNKINR